MVELAALEKRCGPTVTEGSNPSLSAKAKRRVIARLFAFPWTIYLAICHHRHIMTTSEDSQRAEPPKVQSPAPIPSTDGLPVVSFVLGIASIMGPGFLFGIPAIITGVIALRKNLNNRGLSITGIITGSVSTAASLLLLGLFVWVVVWSINNPQIFQQQPASDEQSLFESAET